MQFILNRLGEGSTWKAILSILSGIGVYTFTSAQTDAIIGVVTAIYVLLSVFLPDQFGKK